MIGGALRNMDSQRAKAIARLVTMVSKGLSLRRPI